MSQKSQILAYLKRGRSLTGIQALNLYGCFRLAARIEEIRCMGYRVETDMIAVGKKRVARYRMVA